MKRLLRRLISDCRKFYLNRGFSSSKWNIHWTQPCALCITKYFFLVVHVMAFYCWIIFLRPSGWSYFFNTVLILPSQIVKYWFIKSPLNTNFLSFFIWSLWQASIRFRLWHHMWPWPGVEHFLCRKPDLSPRSLWLQLHVWVHWEMLPEWVSIMLTLTLSGQGFLTATLIT